MLLYTSEIKKGICIKLNNDYYKVIYFLHVKPGKGSAFIRTKLKSITNNKIIEKTFSSGHKIEKIKILSKYFKFLYKENNLFNFMNLEDYNQINVEKKKINNYYFLKEGEKVIIKFNIEKNNEILCVEIPKTTILKVIETINVRKIDTINKYTKKAILETGVTIQVPLFINNNDLIKVNTENKYYLERIKKK